MIQVGLETLQRKDDVAMEIKKVLFEDEYC